MTDTVLDTGTMFVTGHIPRGTRIERDTHVPMFIAALFINIIARTQKQSKCP